MRTQLPTLLITIEHHRNLAQNHAPNRDWTLDRDSSVFAEGIGKLTGYQATINVKENTPPHT